MLGRTARRTEVTEEGKQQISLEVNRDLGLGTCMLFHDICARIKNIDLLRDFLKINYFLLFLVCESNCIKLDFFSE